MTIGERIKRARKEKGVKQKELAEMIGKTASAVCKYEAGITDAPLSVLYAIANNLGINILDLLGEPRPATPTDHKEARLNQLQEECGELTSTAARLRRHLHGDRTLNERYTERKLIADLTEEMADVILVASDVRREFNISEEELFEVINAKMERTEGLMRDD